MSGHTKKVHYDRGTRDRHHAHRSRRDSGVGSSSASDRASLGTAPDTPFTYQQRDEQRDEQRQILGAVQEALDVANERIRHLEAATAKLNIALRESNQENRLLKRERAGLHNKLDDTNDDLESERRMSRRARERSLSSNRQRSPSVSLPRTFRRHQEEGRASIMPKSRDEKDPPAKSIDLAVISQPTRFFQVGRVFKTLWTEPAGETATDTDKEYYHPVGYGQLSFTKMRRFVVVRKRLHSCLCLAISTYGGQGSAKKDSRSEDHAVVYASTDPPPPNDDFVKSPIPIIIEEPSEMIDSKSVIDFGRVYTVEHNVKVSNLGRIAKSDKKRLDQYFAETIGMSADLEDEGYGGDTPISRPDSRPDRWQASSAVRLSNETLPWSRASTTINPTANPFLPSRSQSTVIPSYPPPPGYKPNSAPFPTTPTGPGQPPYFSPPPFPGDPSKWPTSDGRYHIYPI